MSGLDLDTITEVTASVREVFAAGTGAAVLAKALDELGWTEVVEADPAIATTILFSEQGRALASSRLLDDVVLNQLGSVLPAASGSRAVLYPRTGATPGTVGILLGAVEDDTEIVSMAMDENGNASWCLRPASDFTTEAITGFDPTCGWSLARTSTAATAVAAAGTSWDDARAAGRLAITAEIIGVCASALELAVSHTSARHQYGRALASFQAVRHQLSESHAAIESARNTLAAAYAASPEHGGGAWAAKVAKVRAGQTQAIVMRRGIQVLGAMGLTLESEMHRYVTRAAALDALLGGHAELAVEIGTELLGGAAPARVVTI
ncbi:MAG: putative Acyl-CoA dehydrogenase, short-chain specific [Marmoricola sp.]|nr:putative Acyl-CoA dehydrogenase, short-chain specific [Marmoricola sp.]